MGSSGFEELPTGLSSPGAGPLMLNYRLLTYLNSLFLSPSGQRVSHLSFSVPTVCLSGEMLKFCPGPLASSISLPITPCHGRTANPLTLQAEPSSVQHPYCITGSPRANGLLPGAPVTLSVQGRIHTPQQPQVCGKDTCFYLANPQELSGIYK